MGYSYGKDVSHGWHRVKQKQRITKYFIPYIWVLDLVTEHLLKSPVFFGLMGSVKSSALPLLSKSTLSSPHLWGRVKGWFMSFKSSRQKSDSATEMVILRIRVDLRLAPDGDDPWDTLFEIAALGSCLLHWVKHRSVFWVTPLISSYTF